jgi:non-ribosomal peptide synthase protein (TIGR01720 family)
MRRDCPSCSTETLLLDAADTDALLRGAAQALGARTEELLLCALARTLGRLGGQHHVALLLEGHGREDLFADLDLTRTVGWFTSTYPLLLPAGGASSEYTLRAVKQRLRTVPARGVGHGILATLHPDAAVRARLGGAAPTPQVSFNYLGQFDGAAGGTFTPAAEPRGSEISPTLPRTRHLDVIALVQGGRLAVSLSASAAIAPLTLRALRDQLGAELAALLDAARAPALVPFAPVDFPLARLEQSVLDVLLAGRRAQEIEDVLPLLPLQREMIRATGEAPRSGTYVIQTVFRIAGEFAPDAFAASWRLLLERHPHLGASYHPLDGNRAVMVIPRHAEMTIQRREKLASGDEDELERMLVADRRAGFDPARGPLMRGELWHTGDREWRFVWTFHHVLLDGWSTSRLVGELLACYSALAAGRRPALPPVMPYREHVRACAKLDADAARARQRDRFRGFAGPTLLPGTDPGPLPLEQDSVVLLVDETVTARIEALAQTHGLTTGTLVHAAFALLLAARTDREDVAFGMLVSGRNGASARVEEIVGLLINVLPVRITIERDRPLVAWLLAQQAWLAELRQDDQAPTAMPLGVASPATGVPPVECSLVFENFPAPPQSEAGELEIRHLRSIEATSYPLDVVVTPGARFEISALFQLARYRREEVEALLAGFARLLAALPAHLHDTVAGLLAAVAESDVHPTGLSNTAREEIRR